MENDCECTFTQKNIPGCSYASRDENWNHREAHDTRKFIIFGLPLIALLIIGLASAVDYRLGMDEIVDLIIERGNCIEMSEYIAFKEWGYTNVEHAYKWTCVDNKSQEFD